MSSRKSIQQVVSPTEPVGGSLGDEWLNSTTGVLRKLTIVNGVVQYTDVVTNNYNILQPVANVKYLDGAMRDPSWSSISGNNIPVRHPSGYLYSNYFNTPADKTTGVPSHIAIQTNGDDYIRWNTFAQFRTNLGIIDPVTLAASLRANINISGGGTITVNGSGSVLWNARFIVISNSRGTTFATNGYFDINCPTSGTITGVGGATSQTATAAGIPLGDWLALYYILPIGSAEASVAANFRIVGYTSNVDIPYNWILICVKNPESGYFHFPNGINLKVNQNSTNIITNGGSFTGTGATFTSASGAGDGQIRLKTSTDGTGYGVIHRHDGSDYYLLLTANNNSNGTWTTARPFSVSLATGNVNLGTTTAASLTVTGDLTVNGTTTTVNSTTLTVDDKNLELGSVATPTDTTADGGGITLKGTTDKTFNWINATGYWTSSHSISAPRLVSTVAQGTAPLIVASTTLVTNLNADLLDGLNSATTNTASTIVARDASGNFAAGTITATLSGNATNVTGTVAVANGGTGVTTSTGTGSVVLSANPTFTGTVNAANLTLSGVLTGTDMVAKSTASITDNKGSISGTVNIDFQVSEYVKATIAGVTNFTFSNVGTGVSRVILLKLTNGGAYAVGFPAGTKFANGIAPALTVTGNDTLAIEYDSVSTIYTVHVIAKNVS